MAFKKNPDEGVTPLERENGDLVYDVLFVPFVG